MRYPDQGLAIAVLCNLDSVGPAVNSLTQGVADICLAEVFADHSTTATTGGTSEEPPAKVSLSPEELARKIGLYRNPTTDAVGRIFIRDGKLRASASAGESHSVELTPMSSDRFIVVGTPIVVEFLPHENGKPQMVRVTGDDPKPILQERVEPFAPSSTELSKFDGRYASEELGVTYTISASGSDLILTTPDVSHTILQPIFSDAFAGGAVSVVKFTRDPNGTLTGFTVNARGARGLRFDRLAR